MGRRCRGSFWRKVKCRRRCGSEAEETEDLESDEEWGKWWKRLRNKMKKRGNSFKKKICRRCRKGWCKRVCGAEESTEVTTEDIEQEEKGWWSSYLKSWISKKKSKACRWVKKRRSRR